MQLKFNEKVKAAVEVDGQIIINMENSQVYESIENEEAFIYIKTIDPSTNKEVKIRFLKK
jgi:hypothetical protein